jgi:predicted 3-demethylubiquinone-9 3-methyltransferase (glyoxalase superfamily)
MEHTNMKPKNTICLWFDKDAHAAARFAAGSLVRRDEVDPIGWTKSRPFLDGAAG